MNQILSHYSIHHVLNIKPLGSGRINQTFLVDTVTTKFVLQKLHSELDLSVLEDIEAVTSFLQKSQVRLPKLIETKDGSLGVVNKNEVWRLLEFIPGLSFESGVTQDQARSAAQFLGRFHVALRGFEYEFEHEWPHFHDFDYHFKKLEKLTKTANHPETKELAAEILSHKQALPQDFRHLPQQVIHGDPKLPNFIFNEEEQAITLVDLDTFNSNSVLIDLADMIRSFCKISKENKVDFNFEIYEEIVKGYQEKNNLTQAEKSEIVNAVQLIMLELSARYLNDVYEQNYFNFDLSRFPSLAEQNLFNTTKQMQQFRSFTQKESSSGK